MLKQTFRKASFLQTNNNHLTKYFRKQKPKSCNRLQWKSQTTLLFSTQSLSARLQAASSPVWQTPRSRRDDGPERTVTWIRRGQKLCGAHYVYIIKFVCCCFIVFYGFLGGPMAFMVLSAFYGLVLMSFVRLLFVDWCAFFVWF